MWGGERNKEQKWLLFYSSPIYAYLAISDTEEREYYIQENRHMVPPACENLSTFEVPMDNMAWVLLPEWGGLDYITWWSGNSHYSVSIL